MICIPGNIVTIVLLNSKETSVNTAYKFKTENETVIFDRGKFLLSNETSEQSQHHAITKEDLVFCTNQSRNLVQVRNASMESQMTTRYREHYYDWPNDCIPEWDGVWPIK